MSADRSDAAGTGVETFIERQKRLRREREALERADDVIAEPQGEPLEIGDPLYTDQARRYCGKALSGMLATVATTPEGNRNQELNDNALRAFRWCVAGLLNREDVAHRMRQAALEAGLDPAEIGPTLSSAWAGAMRLGPALPEVRRRPDVLDTLEAVHALEDGSTVDPQTGEVTIVRTSWWPRDVDGLLAGEVVEEPAPEFLARDDGHRLFYAGKVNALIGESESGKTWVGLLTVAQTLQVGLACLYLDFEDTLAGIVGRLRALGVTDAQLARLTYISPDEGFDLPQKRDLMETLKAGGFALVLFDGVNAAMTLLGLDLEKNKDATDFSLRLLRPLKRTGACLVTIDHVTKSKDNRGSYAIGAQAKRADIDGCALIVEVAQPFGRGQTGKLRLTVGKDRPGRVRAVAAGAKNAGLAVLSSQPDGTVRITVEAPDLRPAAERGTFRPTVLMERVSLYLEALPKESPGVSENQVIKQVRGGSGPKQLPLALQTLIDEGYVCQTLTVGGTKQNKLLRPYRQGQDPRLALDPFGMGQGGDAVPGPTGAPARSYDDDEEGWWHK